MQRAVAQNDFMTSYMRAPKLKQPDVSAASVALWFVDIGASQNALCSIEKATPRLSWRERMDFEGASDWRRARIRYGARIALRLVLERWLGPDAVRGVSYAVDQCGKPYLRESGLDFSLSYSGDLVLIGARIGGAIGVDLEQDRELKMAARRRNQIIAAAGGMIGAPALADEMSQAADPAGFLQAWTRMEAVSKATGMGIGRVLGHFGVIGAKRAAGGTTRQVAADFVECHDLSVDDVELSPGLYASIAQIRGTVMPEIQQLPGNREQLEAFASDLRYRH